MTRQDLGMTFLLPCSDAASNTTLCRCTAPNTVAALDAHPTTVALTVAYPSTSITTLQRPNTMTQDTLDDEEPCALTMGNCWDHDDKTFFREHIVRLEADVFAKATKLLALASWKKLPGMVDELEDIGCLRVAGCGHKFSGTPLLYTMMTNGFKCPICRYGGSAKINLGEMVEGDFPPGLWDVLCVLCTVVRRRDIIERNHQAHFSTLQLARQTITTVYRTMPWIVRFVLYNEASPAMHSIPFAQIPLKMEMDRTALEARQGIWPDDIVLNARARGSSARQLSAQIRDSGSYFVEIIVDMETVRHVVFQSAKMHYKKSTSTVRAQQCFHTEETIGDCAVHFEKCQYRNEHFVQNVTYTVPETQLRALIIGIGVAGMV